MLFFNKLGGDREWPRFCFLLSMLKMGVLMLHQEDLNRLAAFMLNQHGSRALDYAESAMAQLLLMGEERRADAWRMVGRAVRDMLEGRITRDGHAIH
ncbi:conserved protein [Tepidicaulis marinus]|uniref:Conserved protein n=2 Tax=Tepidicaulis marinus TaxID=1333998 RepID=A0A081BBQ8_9HYPH|nr:conserved protein [Tepidicaulis marinus]